MTSHPSFIRARAVNACLTLAALGGLFLSVGCSPTDADSAVPDVELSEERSTSFAVRGWGSIYLLPEPGQLEIVVEKQDLNRFAGADILKARLLGPDREEIAVARFPDDGNPQKGGGAGPIQRAELSAEVTEPGLYKLDLEARTGQELGHDVAWGISTNAPKMAVESLLSFAAADREGEVFFYPPAPIFEVQVRGIGSQQDLRLENNEGEVVHTFDTRTESVLTKEFSAAGEAPFEPWRLHMEEQRASIRISGQDGEAEGFYPNFEYWAPEKDLLFPVEEYRWLVTPHQVALHPEGEPARLSFAVYNGGESPGTFALSLETPPDTDAEIDGAADLQLDPRESQEVFVNVEAWTARPGTEASIRLKVIREEPTGLADYATIRLRGGTAPTDESVSPVVLKPYRHENLLFGYYPDYVTNVPYFDRENRPFIRSRKTHRHHSTGLEILGEDGWRHGDYMAAVRRAVPDVGHTWFASYRLANKVGFDADGDAYTLVSVTRKNRPVSERRALLLHTGNRGETFEAHPLGDTGDATFELENFSGHNNDARPPPALLYTRVADHPAAWAWLNELDLFLPQKTSDGKVEPGEPIQVSDRALNPAAHSGGGSALASREDLTFIVWGEAVDPESDAPGVPSYISVYDRTSGELAEKQFLAHAAPINDSHNSPAVVLDSEGYIHVVIGAHGRPFQYLRSKEPLRIDAGWTEPVDILSTGRIEVGADVPERGAQTYVGLVCTPDDTLHLVSRQWREGVDEFHDGHLYAALSYQRKRPGGEWEEPVPLVIPPLPDYSVFYHKLSIDRMGRLYLGYNYYSTHDHYRNDLPGRLNHQAVLMSADGGDNWKLATTKDFLDGMRP